MKDLTKATGSPTNVSAGPDNGRPHSPGCTLLRGRALAQTLPMKWIKRAGLVPVFCTANLGPHAVTRDAQAYRTEVWFWLVMILLSSFVAGSWIVGQFPAPLRGAALLQPRVQLAPPSSLRAPVPPLAASRAASSRTTSRI